MILFKLENFKVSFLVEVGKGQSFGKIDLAVYINWRFQDLFSLLLLIAHAFSLLEKPILRFFTFIAAIT